MTHAPDSLPSVGQLRGANPAQVRAAASAARSVQRQVEAQLRALARMPGGWEGPAGVEATARHAEVVLVGEVLEAALGDLATALEGAADGVDGARRLLAHAELTCGRAGGHLTDVGGVVGLLDPAVEPVVRASALEARRRYAVAALGLRRVQVPRWMMASPGSLTAPPTGSGLGEAPMQTSLPTIPQHLDPQAMASWFAELPVTAQAVLVARQPDTVAAAEGLPAWAHDAANRLRLDRAIRDADLALQAATTAALSSPTPIDDLGLGALRDRVADLRAIADVLDRQDGHDRQLLAFDLSGRRVLVAISTGDIDRAGRLAVFVPGFTVTPATHLRGYDTRVTASSDLASSIDRSWGTGEGVVGITWLGYAAPQIDEVLDRSRSVASRLPAEEGGQHLRAFLDGLAASRERSIGASTPDVSIWAHSYGSLVAGSMLAAAAQRHESTPVRAVVALGSPGMGVSIPAQLGLRLDQIFVAEAELDPVPQLGVFGSDPGHWAGVTQLETEARPLPDGSPGAAGRGHESYLTPGSTSAWNLAAIAAGRPDLALTRWRCDEPRVLRLRDPACRA